ncbi:hypothetical protein A0H81_04397 [Grifola frondosa]|uniref:TEA domain-containing protein n=1 Tax=Grifola frondosa TaxID=5627 RepID=A0A1C7ME87_GRIFR|nr:hypothetical protein A0H81_04397 [Grifola frondosa]
MPYTFQYSVVVPPRTKQGLLPAWARSAGHLTTCALKSRDAATSLGHECGGIARPTSLEMDAELADWRGHWRGHIGGDAVLRCVSTSGTSDELVTSVVTAFLCCDGVRSLYTFHIPPSHAAYMGRDVIFTYRRRIHAMSSPPSPSRSSATNDSMESLHDASRSKKSLTPQRKHHKLLKDGSEVWSQEVEAIFVDGLRKYWESPWATYSRGRSRWRNQFLVDHLKRAGIERSKKQVASHIQVLRNMWRGEPEFHLVAGGEELFQENGLLAPSKQKASADPPETSSPSTLEFVESSRRSPSSNSSPEYSASEFSLDLPSPISLSHVASPPHTVSYGELSVDDSVGMPLPTSLTLFLAPFRRRLPMSPPQFRSVAHR